MDETPQYETYDDTIVSSDPVIQLDSSYKYYE